MYNIKAGGLSAWGLTMDDMAAFGCRLLIDPTNPFIAAYRAWKECYRNLADGMLSPGFTEEEAAAAQKAMFATIELDPLLQIEKRTVET